MEATITHPLEWLRSLRLEAERAAESHGPLRGSVREAQRPWSWTLDRLAAEEQAA